MEVASRASKQRRSPQLILEKGLPRLKTLLSALSRQRRLQALQRFTEGLRGSLLNHIQLQQMLQAKQLQKQRQPPKLKEDQVKDALLSSGGICPGVPGSQARDLSTERGICAIRSGKGMSGWRYYARATIAGVAISSRCVHTLEEALQLRRFLKEVIALKHLHRSNVDAGLPGEWLQAAFAGDDHLKAWTFRATVDARCWVGRTLSSRQVASVQEVVSLQKELEAARREGWPSLRAAWVRCMQEPRQTRRFGHRALGSVEAECAAAAAEAQASAAASGKLFVSRCSPLSRVASSRSGAVARERASQRRQDRRKRMADREAMRKAARAERAEGQLRRLVQKLERALKMRARALERQRRSKEYSKGAKRKME
eukprot:TRINITY_DN33713_c0_g1_i2.p1 TRINITY_DN33713_c0_g1~~TRINITY_DN33713_c0_g1_i2.p1  ORF type:complete len:370 (-),score=86.46 TRINITY_DN33713_c0_g1_i2:59-1168(-)